MTDLLTPAYRVTAGNQVVDTTSEPRASTLVSLTTTADLQTPAAEAVLVLGHAEGLRPRTGDEMRVELGYAGADLVTVLTGTVVAVESGLLSTRVHVQDGGYALLRSTTERTYEGLSAGGIVRELAGQAGVEVASAEDGIDFPAYVIDGHRPAALHLRELATLCGFDVYLDPRNRLVFARWAGGTTVHVYEYAKHLVELSLQRLEPAHGAVGAWGESPGLGRGTHAWAWLTKDFTGSVGRAGTGTPAALLERSALRTADSARIASAALATEITRRALTGRLTGIGRPEVALGHAVRLRGVPEPGADDTYQVRAVTHRLTKSRGFTTSVAFRSQQGGR